MNLHVVARTLYPANIGEEDLDKGIVDIHEEVFRGGGGPGRGPELVQFLRLVAGLHEPVEANRLYQIVDDIEVETFRRELFVGCDDDDHGSFGQALDELQSRQSGHLDVHEQQVDGVLLQGPGGFEGIATSGHEFQERHLADIVRQQAKGQRLIIDCDTADHQCKFISSLTINQFSSRLICKICWFPYNNFSRRLTLPRPMPEPLSFISSEAGLYRFFTEKWSTPSVTCRSIPMAGFSIIPTPCLKAFSTKGMSSIGSIS